MNIKFVTQEDGILVKNCCPGDVVARVDMPDEAFLVIGDPAKMMKDFRWVPLVRLNDAGHPTPHLSGLMGEAKVRITGRIKVKL